MRQTLSPGWQTHLMFAEFDGEVTEHADHIVVRSPRSPGYYWGNFLLYDRLPTAADFGPWMQRFEDAIRQPEPGTGHVAFGMHAQSSSFTPPQPFVDAGFSGFGVATLTLQRSGLLPLPLPMAHSGSFELRPLHLSSEMSAEMSGVVELNMACNDEGYEPAGYRQFRTHQMQRYADMAAAGMGHWWGAMHEGRTVAALGLFGERHVGRFQHVATHPDFRRQGLCSALVHAACTHGFAQMGWHTLVLGADPEDVAIDIYRKLGLSASRHAVDAGAARR